MSIEELALEYVKVLLSPQVVIVAALIWFSITFKNALTSRLENSDIDISTPGGGRLQVSQPIDKAADAPTAPELESDAATVRPVKQEALTDTQQTIALINSWRSAAFTWEYRYLNYHLVRHSQQVLDWFYNRQNPITYELYDTSWNSAIPRVEERQTVYQVLTSHYLLIADSQRLISISDKGKEYCNWPERWKPN